MKHITMAAAAALLLAGTAAAQTASPTPGPSTPAVSAPSAGPSARPPAASPAPAAVSSAANPRTTAAPVPGANSFTMREAQSRITKAGYTSVKALKKDGSGIWRGTAMKDGKSVPVALDYQGNVVSQ